MPRTAVRRSTHPPEPERARVPWRRLSITAILRWIWPAIGLAAATSAALALEHSGAWLALRGRIESLDFDPSRAFLIQAWIAAVALAAIAALLTGRPWISGLAATVFTGVTYVWQFDDQVRREVPAIFGLKESLQPGMLLHNEAVVLGIALLSACVGAATADEVRRGTIWLAASIWAVARSGPPRAGRIAAVMASLAMGSLLVAALAFALDIDPILRYGPENDVYVAPVVPTRPLPPYPSHSPSPDAPGTPEPVPSQGQVLDGTYHSDAMGEDRHYLIYLPPTYGLQREANRLYPVLYLLHGDPGSPIDWVHVGATRLLDVGIASGAMPQTILVMPDGNGHVTAAAQWADRYDGRDRIEDALLELVHVIDLQYRTLADRDHRLIAGLSSGGFGAANLAARHPDVFGTAISLSGYFVAVSPVFGGNSNYIRANSPYYVVQDQAAARTVFFILVVGMNDPVYQGKNTAFANLLKQLGVPHDLRVITGGHSPEVWMPGLALALQDVAPRLATVVRLPEPRHLHGMTD